MIDRIDVAVKAWARTTRNAEVPTGEAAAVARALAVPHPMPAKLVASLWCYYIVPGSTDGKLPALRRYLGEPISRAEFFRNLDRAHHWLLGRLG